jgi:hypothetical protein
LSNKVQMWTKAAGEESAVRRTSKGQELVMLPTGFGYSVVQRGSNVSADTDHGVREVGLAAQYRDIHMGSTALEVVARGNILDLESNLGTAIDDYWTLDPDQRAEKATLLGRQYDAPNTAYGYDTGAVPFERRWQFLQAQRGKDGKPVFIGTRTIVDMSGGKRTEMTVQDTVRVRGFNKAPEVLQSEILQMPGYAVDNNAQKTNLGQIYERIRDSRGLVAGVIFQGQYFSVNAGKTLNILENSEIDLADVGRRRLELLSEYRLNADEQLEFVKQTVVNKDEILVHDKEGTRISQGDIITMRSGADNKPFAVIQDRFSNKAKAVYVDRQLYHVDANGNFYRSQYRPIRSIGLNDKAFSNEVAVLEEHNIDRLGRAVTYELPENVGEFEKGTVVEPDTGLIRDKNGREIGRMVLDILLKERGGRYFVGKENSSLRRTLEAMKLDIDADGYINKEKLSVVQGRVNVLTERATTAFKGREDSHALAYDIEQEKDLAGVVEEYVKLVAPDVKVSRKFYVTNEAGEEESLDEDAAVKKISGWSEEDRAQKFKRVWEFELTDEAKAQKDNARLSSL